MGEGGLNKADNRHFRMRIYEIMFRAGVSHIVNYHSENFVRIAVHCSSLQVYERRGEGFRDDTSLLISATN